MAWIRIDDHFDEHPKLAQAGPLGWAVWLAGLAYCNRNLTDGFIPWTRARSLVSWEFLGNETGDSRGRKVYSVSVSCGMVGDDVTSQMVIDRLVVAGLWEEVDGGYRVHDYDQYQPSKEQVEADRAANAERQAKWRERNGKSNGVTKPVTKPVTNGPVTSPPNPNPIPSNNHPSDGGASAPTPIRAGKKLPRNGRAQTIVAVWYESAGGKPVSYAKAVGLGQVLADQSATDDEVRELYQWMGEQTFFQGKWDFGTAVSQFEKFRQSRKPAAERKREFVV